MLQLIINLNKKGNNEMSYGVFIYPKETVEDFIKEYLKTLYKIITNIIYSI